MAASSGTVGQAIKPARYISVTVAAATAAKPGARNMAPTNF